MAKFDLKYTAKGVSITGKGEADTVEAITAALPDVVVTTAKTRKPRTKKAE